MITLNLLDSQRKTEYLWHRLLKTVQKAMEIFFFFILIIGIILSVAQYYLQKNFETVTEQSAFINKSIGNFNQEIFQLNSQLKDVGEIQNKYIAWSPVLIEITNAIPDGIKISEININQTKNSLKIKGLAQNRDNFLSFKKNLENIYFVNQVDSPLTNLLKKDNVDFEFSITLDLSRLYES